MKTKLWAHQRAAADFLEPLGRGMLALEMGTGKTLAALELLRRWDAQNVLVLCPLSVARVWPAEFAKHIAEPRQVRVYDKARVNDRCDALRKDRDLAEQRGERFCAVMNYEATIGGSSTTHRDFRCNMMEKTLRRLDWDCIIMDECHRIKSASGRTSRLVSRVSSGIPHRLGLTGTPMPHGPLDVYAQFRAIDHRPFGTSHQKFKHHYAVMGGFESRQVVAFQNLDELHDRMYRWTYRVRAEDVLDLPPWTDEVRTFELPSDVRRAYNSLEKLMIADVEGGVVTAVNVLSKLVRLAQITSGFYHDADTDEIVELSANPKEKLLEEVMEDVCSPGRFGDDAILDLAGNEPSREPLIVFCRFIKDLDTVHRVANGLGIPSCELSGRRKELDEFQQQAGPSVLAAQLKAGPPVLAAQLKAGGLGIDLTRARVQVYFSLDFNLGDYEQTRARIHRPGQTLPVTYLHFIGLDTVDEKIMGALSRRKAVVQHVIDDIREEQE